MNGKRLCSPPRYNSSVFWCQKGCDFARGRNTDPILREEADNMCKMMAASNYALLEHEDLGKLPISPPM